MVPHKVFVVMEFILRFLRHRFDTTEKTYKYFLGLGRSRHFYDVIMIELLSGLQRFPCPPLCLYPLHSD